LLDAVCGRRADPLAWTTLEAIAREESPAEAESHLAAWLGHRLLRVPPDQRERLAATAAEGIAAAPSGPRLAVVLAGTPDSAWQACAAHLALAIAQRLPPPLTPDVMAAIQPRLGDRSVPSAVRVHATAQLL